MNRNQLRPSKIHTLNRVQILKGLLIVVGIILIGRLFYVQIIRHDYYQAQALAEHIKKFEISAPRGIINLEDGNSIVPVVLNEQRYTIYADPKYISDAGDTANKLIGLLGGDKAALKKKLETSNSRYVILAKKMTKDQANRIDALQLNGIGKQEISARTYPEGNLASQVLGFVNDDGKGQYGVEEYLNSSLSGKSGLEKAVTDVRGIPLAVNNDNILLQAQPGKNITLTLDIGMQRMVEDILKTDVAQTQSKRGMAIIMDAKTGAIKAMAGYPNFDPSQYTSVTDQSVFSNPNVTMPWEPGSVMKPLLFGAAFTEGTANPESSYFDPGYVDVDGSHIVDSINWGAQTMTLHDVINKSLNTGAVFVLKTLGGGDINEKARTIWYNYLTAHYFFGKLTGIEQSGEAAGFVNGPNQGYGLNVRYANMSFGQGITLTPLQLVAAYDAILDGGTYYKPTLIANTDNNGSFKPTIVANNVISSQASSEIRNLLQAGLEGNNKAAVRDGYILGAKSGTAQIPDGKGGYRTDAYDGVYAGFIGNNYGPQYIMVVRLDEPKTSASGFASGEAAKVWAEMSNKLIDNFAIQPISS